jgi:alpha-tubulin suppressor-like RCC1 family protein
LGHRIHQNIPHIVDLQNIITIYSEGRCAGALSKSELYIWGTDKDQIQSLPLKFDYKNFRKLSFGDSHTVAITNTGDVYTWGRNNYGQLGLGHNLDQKLPQKLGLKSIIKICCGYYHTIAMSVFGEIYVWGKNNYGQLGLGHCQSQNSPQKLII